MRDELVYEWDAEEYYPADYQDTDGPKEAGEVRDHNYAPTALEALQRVMDGSDIPGVDLRLVLVRRTGNEYHGMTGQSWAYVVDGKLPEQFLDEDDRPMAAVPARFIKELEKAKKEIQATANA